MEKSLGTRLHFWGVFQFTQTQPLPSPTNKDGRVYLEFFFSEFQLCIRWGRENCKKISKRMHFFYEGAQNREKKRILHHCPRDVCP